MCGIVGEVLLRDECNKDEVLNAVNCIEHRGPDGAGIKYLQNGRISLGHRRLSIIDLSDAGAQPMCNEDESLWVTFNGEIYNHKILRELLIERGHRFKSHSDTEVLLHGYEEFGVELFPMLEGMFAFALWNDATSELILVRDRFGIKPLVYYHSGNELIFGSELKSFYKFRQFTKEMDKSSLIDYLHFYQVPAHKTIWKNTFKLLPGHYLRCKKDLTIEIKSYWTLEVGNKHEDENVSIEKVDQLLKRSVKDHLESDVPIGVFLSSGYDSSALASYTLDYNKELNTFSIGFKDSKKSEHIEASFLAKELGTHHYEKILGEDYMAVLDDLISFYDEPFAITSMVSYFYVSNLASLHNKVVFSGDGGDEVFGGYNWYRDIEKVVRKRSIIKKWFSTSFSNRRFYQKEYFKYMGSNLSWIKGILSDEMLSFYPKDPYWPFELRKEQWELSPIKVFQLLDFKFFLPDVALPRCDRSSMANSLEVRVPMLNHHLVEYLLGLDVKVYHRPEVKKFLLHENIIGRIPESILALPKKGFGNPLDPFYENRSLIIQRIKNSSLMTANIFKETLKPEDLKKKELWLIFNLVLWWDKWVNE